VIPRAITGLGVLSAIGIGREAFVGALREGSAPNRHVTVLDPASYGEPLLPALVEVPAFDATQFLGDKGLRSLDRQTKLLVVAARLALADSGLKKDGAFVALGPERVGLCVSNAYGSLESVVELDRVAVLEDARYINPAKFPNTVANSAAGYVSIWEDLHALNVALSDGNTGALDAVISADVYLSTGRADAIVVGGGEALSEALYLAFRRLGSLAAETLLGEGAALLVMESMESAKARGAKVDALVVGAAATCGAPEHAGSLLHASSDAMERAISAALADAGAARGEVSLVVSGVAQPGVFADAELAGISRVLDSVPVVAPKAMLGETLGAGGAMGMAAAIAWMSGAPVRRVLRGEAPPPGASLPTTVVTALGYYGNAAAVVLRRA
jgi:3-oxoacyl-(acyl-carrier-protein) synthase